MVRLCPPCFSQSLSAFSQRLMTSRKKSAGFSCSSHWNPVEDQVHAMTKTEHRISHEWTCGLIQQNCAKSLVKLVNKKLDQLELETGWDSDCFADSTANLKSTHVSPFVLYIKLLYFPPYATILQKKQLFCKFKKNWSTSLDSVETPSLKMH